MKQIIGAFLAICFIAAFLVMINANWEELNEKVDEFKGFDAEQEVLDSNDRNRDNANNEETNEKPSSCLNNEHVQTIYGDKWGIDGVENGTFVFCNPESSGDYIWREGEGILDVTVGNSASSVTEAWGEPEGSVRRGMTNVSFPADHYDIYVRDDKEITVFYDRHEGNIIKSIYVVSQGQATGMNRYYAQAENWVDEDQAQIMFGLINKDRVSRGLNPLTWREELVPVAEAHSKDMNKRDYFSHTNPDGEGPADRAKEAGVSFRMIGENLAYGQSNAVYAHEGLMDSKGHRENILNPHYEEVAIGIDVNDEGAPYFTVLFYTGR